MKPGLYANIHAKKERIEKQKATGKPVERMRKPGTKGAPTAAAFKQSAKTAKKGRKGRKTKFISGLMRRSSSSAAARI